MAKKRNSKTRQGLCGLTLAQGHRLTGTLLMKIPGVSSM